MMIPTVNGWADVPTVNGWADVPAVNGWADVPAVNGWADVPAVNGWADVPAVNGWADVPAVNGRSGGRSANRPAGGRLMTIAVFSCALLFLAPCSCLHIILLAHYLACGRRPLGVAPPRPAIYGGDIRPPADGGDIRPIPATGHGVSYGHRSRRLTYGEISSAA